MHKQHLQVLGRAWSNFKQNSVQGGRGIESLEDTLYTQCMPSKPEFSRYIKQLLFVQIQVQFILYVHSVRAED